MFSFRLLSIVSILCGFALICLEYAKMRENPNILDNTGYTSTVYYLPGPPARACKSFNKNFKSRPIQTLYSVEKEAYERFSAHDHPTSILKYYGVHPTIPSSLILELAENRNLNEYRWNMKHCQRPSDPAPEVLYRWAQQSAEALEFAHSLGVYNSDVHCVNFLLDRDLNLKVGDWAGASIDGSLSHSSYRLKYSLFDADGRDVPRVAGISAVTEIFALATALYFMVTCEEPWPELDERAGAGEEIKKRIVEKQFPDTNSLPVLGNIIWRCWRVEFASMTEVLHAIKAEQDMASRALDFVPPNGLP